MCCFFFSIEFANTQNVETSIHDNDMRMLRMFHELQYFFYLQAKIFGKGLYYQSDLTDHNIIKNKEERMR